MAPLVPAPRSRPPQWRRRGLVVAGSLLLILLLTVVVRWATAEPKVTAGRAIPEGPATTVRTIPGVELVQQATRTDQDCAGHSYGRAQQFLARTPCVTLRRALYTGSRSGQPVVVSVATVAMASQQDAAGLQQLVDTDGTGNVSDLLREGVAVEGGPSRLHGASYASQRRGSVLVIVEADTVSGAAHSLDALAEAALALGG